MFTSKFATPFAAIRYEEVPVERESGTQTFLPGSQEAGDAVPECRGVCQVGRRPPRVSHLGTRDQRRRHGHAQVQTATR